MKSFLGLWGKDKGVRESDTSVDESVLPVVGGRDEDLQLIEEMETMMQNTSPITSVGLPESWSCHACTLLNNGSDSKCAVCDTPRGEGTMRPSAPLLVPIRGASPAPDESRADTARGSPVSAMPTTPLQSQRARPSPRPVPMLPLQVTLSLTLSLTLTLTLTSRVVPQKAPTASSLAVAEGIPAQCAWVPLWMTGALHLVMFWKTSCKREARSAARTCTLVQLQ